MAEAMRGDGLLGRDVHSRLPDLESVEKFGVGDAEAPGVKSWMEQLRLASEEQLRREDAV